jgi:hypothetical protein
MNLFVQSFSRVLVLMVRSTVPISNHIVTQQIEDPIPHLAHGRIADDPVGCTSLSYCPLRRSELQPRHACRRRCIGVCLDPTRIDLARKMGTIACYVFGFSVALAGSSFCVLRPAVFSTTFAGSQLKNWLKVSLCSIFGLDFVGEYLECLDSKWCLSRITLKYPEWAVI